jgi:hypothetical protein
MGKSIVMMEKEGGPEGRPLIVTMSFQPAIPQRVARQQSPPLLHRPRNILQVEPATGQAEGGKTEKTRELKG